MTNESSEYVSIGVRSDTRDKVQALKREGESYDTLLRKMADIYDP